MNYITWPFYFMILDDKEITDIQKKPQEMHIQILYGG
jgi:hypothetical protein